MSICIAALVVLAFLGIFSAKYRRWTKEAFKCVSRRVLLKPCERGFGEKVKSIIVASLLKRNHKIAKFTYHHFEMLSWAFTIIFFISLILTANGFYNLYAYGTCDPANPDTCVFRPQAPECSPSCQPCLCGSRNITCDAPEYKACAGDCKCVEAICKVK